LLTNKDKLCELDRTQLNENCSTVLLKKFPEKLGDPGKFLISCDFLRKAECLSLVDLGARINLMPLSVWNKLSLPDLTPTSKWTERALIDVFEGELTLCVGKEVVTFNLDQTSRYSANYSDMTEKRIDVIDMACEEYSQEVLGFFDVIASGNPTPYYDLIVSTTSPTFTPFGNSDFLLEEVDAFLGLEDDPTSSKVNQAYLDSEGGHEPPEVELKDLPPHLEYAFLEGDSKLPVIIAKDLSVAKKTALITVLKSHKRAIAWKLFDIRALTMNIAYTKFSWKRTLNQQSNIREDKTMAEAKSNYTTTEKEMLAVVYAFEKFWCYLIMNKSIVYTDHSALKYLFAKKDSKARLLRWVLLLQEFTFKVIKTKGAKNLAADHLSRLENPHQNVLDPKEINESFPFETLNLVSTRGNSNTPWFADFAN
nr:reverse transcriptase domain-containing protein [Tanacetum cinerariifolium]